MTININGVEIFYENLGVGKPLILLHGNGEDSGIFNVVKDKLAQNFSVYLVDSRNHGKSGKSKILDYYIMAEDVKEFINKLELKEPMLYGFSDGGIIGLLLAIKYPDILSKLIISGANTNPKGIKNFFRLLIKISYFFTRSKLLGLMLKGPDVKKEELNSIKIPTLVLAGENDFVKDENTKFIADNIPNSQLQILKGETHSSYIVNSPKLYDLIFPFII